MNIGDGVTSIGEVAFDRCHALTEVTLGDSVTSIGDSAFRYCSINVLYCYATKPPTINNTVFGDGIESGATLYVPARCGVIYKASDWGNYFDNIIEMD